MFFKETIQGVYYAAHFVRISSKKPKSIEFLQNSILVLDQVLAKRGACSAKGRILERIFIFAFKSTDSIY